MIHDKFKEDIHHHLQDCKSSVEELEEHQTVISEALKKQSMRLDTSSQIDKLVSIFIRLKL